MTERAGRIAAPVAVALFVVIGIVRSNQPAALALAAGAGSIAVCVLLAIRSPTGWPLVTGLATAAAGVTVVCNGNPSSLGWFALCVLAGWAALYAPTPQSVALSAGIVAVLGAQWLQISDEPGWGAWIAGTVFTTVVCLLARRQRALIEQLREAQAGLAERTRAEERNRIAGEMHDVIGHALTVSLLHVSSARLALDDDPDTARASLAEAERLGQQSLAEVRQAVGMLRDPHASTLAPMPGAAQLDDLVTSFRRAGRTVRLEIDGDPGRLTTTAGLAVYRIVQEALTNVVRHAPDAAARVRLAVLDDRTRLVVENDGGAPAVRPADGMGVGIISMRERAESVGGRLTAGPADFGWRVEAVLPPSHQVRA
ncbi:sensor histidine kinase [Aeromicrobium sp.]|uniref:sensor histidine kinase n=1 Tax=Aeromicrobium sp. TaxID=1871063 RepID=UPI002FC6F4E8